LNFEPLRIFAEAAREQSLRKAAEKLNLAPSSVSRQIAILERQIGTALFVRSAQGARLTYAGELMEEFCRTVLLNFDSLRYDLNDLKGQRRSLIKIAAVESIASTKPTKSLVRFQERFPTVSFMVHVMPASAVIEAVKSADVDIGASFCPDPDPLLVTLARTTEPVVAAAPPGHPIAGRESVSLADLQETAIALPETNFKVRQVLDSACSMAGITLAPVLTSNSFDVLKEFVRTGGGVAVMPQGTLPYDSDLGALKIIPVKDRNLSPTYIDFVALRNRRYSSILRKFIAEIQGSCDQNPPADVATT